jgi:hypothetical protein
MLLQLLNLAERGGQLGQHLSHAGGIAASLRDAQVRQLAGGVLQYLVGLIT